MKRRLGFTAVELIAIITIIGILATIVIISYGNWQHSVADKSVKSDVSQATSSLASYNNFKNSYPPNLAGTGFASSPSVGIILYTNTPSIGVYSSLTDDQNAQLFLNVCNANLDGTTNTACTFAGNNNGAKIHVKGTASSNVIWSSPICKTAGAGCGSVVQLTCGPACDTATAAIINQFLQQGGKFPVIVQGNTTPLPEPTMQPNGQASRYCLEGRSSDFTDISYYTTDTNKTPSSGHCPNDSELHYFPPTP